MKKLQNFWGKDYAPWLLVALFFIAVYWVAIDTILPDLVVGGF